MIAMTGGSCIPAVEMAHYLDPLDFDDGPLQRLALRVPEVESELPRDTVPVAVSAATGTAPDVGYPLEV